LNNVHFTADRTSQAFIARAYSRVPAAREVIASAFIVAVAAAQWTPPAMPLRS
jgi:hypothetical protein